jgi:predicted ferric reductase
MSEQFWWYLARSTGMVAAVLLITSLTLGMLMATRLLKSVDRPAWLLAMHRWTSGLAVVMTAGHVAALVADNYLVFGPAEILVPFASEWEPTAVALGVIAMYLLATVQLTSMLMKKIPRKAWRLIHMSSYGAAWTAVIHAGLAGSDTSNRLYRIASLILILAVVSVAVVRVSGSSRRPTTSRNHSQEATELTSV